MADPSSNLVALIDAVAAALNAATAGTFATTFTAKRAFITITDLAQAPDMTKTPPAAPLVVVVPVDDSEERRGMGLVFPGDYELDVVIYARVGHVDPARTTLCDALMVLRQQIRDFFKPIAVMVGIRQAVLTAVDGAPAYGFETLKTKGVLASAQTLKFRLNI